MNWKKICKSSYTLNIDKFSDWAPSHPFTIPHQGPKIKYSEGDEISSASQPVFNVEFTGQPISEQHFPCGYWHKNYIPPQQVIYTSLLYPVEIVDDLNYSVNVISGEFYIDFILIEYSYIEELSLNLSLNDGNFRSVLLSYNYFESLDLDINLNAGNFRQVLLSYIIPTESLDYSLSIDSGIFRRALIEYTYWPHEDLDLSITLISGTHNA